MRSPYVHLSEENPITNIKFFFELSLIRALDYPNSPRLK